MNGTLTQRIADRSAQAAGPRGSDTVGQDPDSGSCGQYQSGTDNKNLGGTKQWQN